MNKIIAVTNLAIIFIAGNLNAQKTNVEFKEIILKQFREIKMATLDYSMSDVHHIYDINIPNNAEVKDYPNYYTVNPVEITMTVTNGYYNIYKAKISYKCNFYKEFKGNYVLFMKGEVSTIWAKTIETSDFSKTLKALPNFKVDGFDAIYTPEDNFPAEWKK